LNSSFLKTVLLAFVPEIGLGGAEVDNLGAAVSVFLHLNALFAVIGVRNPHISADHTATLERPKIALVADFHERARTHIRIADDAFSVALFTKAADCDSRLFSAKNEIRMVLSHFTYLIKEVKYYKKKNLMSNLRAKVDDFFGQNHQELDVSDDNDQEYMR